MRSPYAYFILAIAFATSINVFCFCEKDSYGLERGVFKTVSDDRQNSQVAGADLYVKPHPLRKEFPELFATEAVVIAFGADWCTWCKHQAKELQTPSKEYYIFYVHIDETHKGKTIPTRWGRLIDHYKLGFSVPVVAIIEKGEVKKAFLQYTPWSEIKPHAKKAKKNEKVDPKINIDIGPIHIDWDDDIKRQKRNRRRK